MKAKCGTHDAPRKQFIGVQEVVDSAIAVFLHPDLPEVVKIRMLWMVVNGWCTSTRFQQVVQPSRLCCGMAFGDSFAYAFC